MASPSAAAVTNGTHPTTPPPSDTTPSQPRAAEPEVPQTSLADDGTAKRPRDARLIHLVLSNLGITNYQERVPLQLLDFAYRYTSSVLSDSLRLSAEGYAGQPERGAGGGGRGNKGADAGGEGITVASLRQAIASRQTNEWKGHLPKEFMLEQAADRNRLALPKVEAGRGYGVLLPDEKYCLTGTAWNIKDEFSEDEDVEVEQEEAAVNGVAPTAVREDERMGGLDGAMDEEEDDEGAGRMEDVFGEDEAGGGGEDSMAQD